ncbi:hypothetical protein LEMLEM_LOCUS12206 [Lemmus lemmus]
MFKGSRKDSCFTTCKSDLISEWERSQKHPGAAPVGTGRFSNLRFADPSTCNVHEDCFLPHSEVLLRASVPSPGPQVYVPMMGIRGIIGPCHLILTSSHSGTGGSTVFNPP